MTIRVTYKSEETADRRFRAKGELISLEGQHFKIQSFREPDDRLTFDTEEQAQQRAWSLAVRWRDLEAPEAELEDETGRRSPAETAS